MNIAIKKAKERQWEMYRQEALIYVDVSLRMLNISTQDGVTDL